MKPAKDNLYNIPNKKDVISICNKNSTYNKTLYNHLSYNMMLVRYNNINISDIITPYKNCIYTGYELNCIAFVDNNRYLHNRLYDDIKTVELLNNYDYENEILYMQPYTPILYRYIYVENDIFKISNEGIDKQEYVSPNLKCIIKWSCENNICLLFNEDDKLYSIRNNSTGEYIPFILFDDIYTWDIKMNKQYRNFNLCDDISTMKKIENEWLIYYENGNISKITL